VTSWWSPWRRFLWWEFRTSPGHTEGDVLWQWRKRKAAPTGGASPFAKASGDKEEDGK
jgi:hypothetical protein